MESKDWSGFGYFSPDLEKIKQLLVCSKHQNTWEDTGNVVKVFFSIQSKMKNLRQWKETEFSKPLVVKATTSLLLNSLKFAWKALISSVAQLVDFWNFKRMQKSRQKFVMTQFVLWFCQENSGFENILAFTWFQPLSTKVIPQVPIYLEKRQIKTV